MLPSRATAEPRSPVPVLATPHPGPPALVAPAGGPSVRERARAYASAGRPILTNAQAVPHHAPTPAAPGTKRPAVELWPDRSLVQTIGNVGITNYFGARRKELLQTNGISHVLVCAGELPACHPDHFSYLTLAGFADTTHTELLPQLRLALPWIAQVLAEGGKPLVHCAAGNSRSASVLIAYLMWAHQLSYAQALADVCAHRPSVCPNIGFVHQLRAFADDGCRL